MKKISKLIAIILVLNLLFCNVYPAFAINNTKKTMKQRQETINEYINLSWWADFDDAYLYNYVIKAIENNHDLKIAMLKTEQARQNVKLKMGDELPSIMFGASPAIAKNIGATRTSSLFAMPIIASYEVDIFLKNHDKTKSAKKLYEASKLNEKAVYIAIVSAVGSTYYNIVKADKMIDIQEQIVEERKQIFDLMKQRNEQGITSVSDLVKAEKAYVVANSQLSDLKKIRNQLLTSLSVLIGDSPQNISEYKRVAYSDITKQKQVPQKLSSDIITKRPDYQVAEKMLEKAGIDVRVAKKEFLPTFDIGGLIGFIGAPGMSMSWTNAVAGAGAAAILPVFTGGKRIAALKIYKSKYEQAIQEYQKTNINAIKEINDSLSNLQYDNEKYEKNLYAYNMEQKDYNISKSKYEQGVISYLDLIQKKEVLLSTQQRVVSGEIDNFVNQISLYKAAAANL